MNTPATHDTPSPSEIASLRRRAAIADWILEHNTVELGGRENPENRSLHVALFFGSFDPAPFVNPDKHGHARLTPEVIEAVMKHQSSQTEVFRFSRKKSREAAEAEKNNKLPR